MTAEGHLVHEGGFVQRAAFPPSRPLVGIEERFRLSLRRTRVFTSIVILTQQALITSLTVTKKPVKLFNYGSTDFICVQSAAALILARTGDYVGGGSSRRCRYISPTSPPPAPDPRDSVDFKPSDAMMGQTFLRYPQRGGELYPW